MDATQQIFERLRKNRGLQKPLIKQYNGRWIKELCDGVNIASRYGRIPTQKQT